MCRQCESKREGSLATDHDILEASNSYLISYKSMICGIVYIMKKIFFSKHTRNISA